MAHRRGQARGVTWETVCRLALALPGVEEGTSYGTAALRVKGKFYVRLRNDGESIVLKIGHDAKEVLLQADPEVFFTTDHYNGYPAVLVRLATVRADDLRALLEDAWRLSGPKRLVAAWDDRKACPP